MGRHTLHVFASLLPETRSVRGGSLNPANGCGTSELMRISPIRAMTGSDLQRLQQWRKQVLVVGVLAGLALLAVTDSSWRTAWPRVHRGIQWSGLLLILICILGRTWATLYIGGRKKSEMVTQGPYSGGRHTLYLLR